MKMYKLTDKNDRTCNDTQWGEGVTHTASGEGDLCAAGWIHVYSDPVLALFLNPIHGSFTEPHIWECECSGIRKDDHGLKSGFSSVTTVRRIEVPLPTMEQRILFGILCAVDVGFFGLLEVYHEPSFMTWTDNWLKGNDRTQAAARAAARAAWAVRAAAAEAADIDLVALAHKAMEEDK